MADADLGFLVLNFEKLKDCPPLREILGPRKSLLADNEFEFLNFIGKTQTLC